jgi:hypothetical protein
VTTTPHQPEGTLMTIFKVGDIAGGLAKGSNTGDGEKS